MAQAIKSAPVKEENDVQLMIDELASKGRQALNEFMELDQETAVSYTHLTLPTITAV